MQYACIDIGGTAIKYAMMTEDGQILAKGQVLTKVETDGSRAIPGKIAAIVCDLQKEYGQAAGVAVCSPGLIDAEKGEVIFAGPNFPGYSGMKLREEIEKLTQLPCTVENDVNAAGLGESWLGAGKGAKSAFCMFVGTGVGGALVLDGHLVHGAAAAAGEIGFLPLAGGSLEQLASMTALLQNTGAATGEEVFARAAAGEEKALTALEDMTRKLACGLAQICCVVNPEVLIMGGAVMAQREFFEPRLHQYLAELLPPALLKHTRIAFAQLGTAAGFTGALRHFLQKAGQR
ncbi:putative ROK family protein [Selenomonas ruminantium subsp. lactilytica TAM6421]|uniref:Putative ROK family protein n=1 Tax=Selenomonas ruminantium subsp. lactilytica (strain NBRC 103574 / TAM6421) TaxID=927704 RepID=I0GRV0_SELRL|nr:ROK family protein [Selenomonas ruminantium]BAL83487.1 putative ROK family protein [Selenomonas ruminantium subsp. lactilytica TAM6421]